MIHIAKGATSQIYVTFTELMLNPSTSWPLVVMTNETTLQKKAFLLPVNESPSTRYDQYSIIETSGPEDPTNGVVTLSPVGFWKYEAYEWDPSEAFDPQNYTTGVPIEIGRASVTGEDEVEDVYK